MRSVCHICHPVNRDTGDLVALSTSGFPCSSTWTSSQYHRGRNPTRSPPFTTSSIAEVLSLSTLTPEPGTNLARHTATAWSLSTPASFRITSFKNVRNWYPQSRLKSGSHAPGLLRTRRGNWIVLNDCTVEITPTGVRNPTTISYRRNSGTLTA